MFSIIVFFGKPDSYDIFFKVNVWVWYANILKMSVVKVGQ